MCGSWPSSSSSMKVRSHSLMLIPHSHSLLELSSFLTSYTGVIAGLFDYDYAPSSEVIGSRRLGEGGEGSDVCSGGKREERTVGCVLNVSCDGDECVGCGRRVCDGV